MTKFGTCEGLKGCASRGEKLKCGEICESGESGEAGGSGEFCESGETGESGEFCESGETGESGEFFANLVYLVSPVVLASPDALEVIVY